MSDLLCDFGLEDFCFALLANPFAVFAVSGF